MKRRFLISSLIALVVVAIVFGVFLHKKNSTPALNQDLWLNALLTKKIPLQERKPPTEDELFNTYQTSIASSSNPLALNAFTEKTASNTQGTLKDASDYIELANSLFRARERIRLLKPLEAARKGLYLLASLTDETLYAMTILFPAEARKKPKWQIDFEPSSPSCLIGKYFDLSLCPGDVVLSKSEAFSSSLFAFRVPGSGTFSHASIPYFTAGMPNPLLVEAEPTGELFEDSSQESQLPKIAVYRLTRATDAERMQIDQSVKKIVQSRGAIPSFNFQLDPKCEPGRYFCTEIVYCAYRDSGLNASLNPYEQSLWTPPAPIAQELIERISSTRKEAIPLPGDVELNPAFTPVGFSIVLDQIPTLRIHAAIVDAFVRLMHEDQNLRQRYLEALGKFGDQRLEDLKADTTALDFLDQLGLPMKNKLLILRRQLPPETRLKEIAFYFHFQNQMLRKITGLLLGTSSQNPVSFGDLEKAATPELRSGTEAFIAALQSF